MPTLVVGPPLPDEGDTTGETFDTSPLGQPDAFLPENRRAPYRFWKCTRDFRWRTGLRQMPVAGSEADAEVLQVCAPVGRLVVRFRAVRDKAEPLVPDPAIEIDGAVLLAGRIVTSSPLLLPDGLTWRYETRGRYTYSLRRPLTPATGFSRPGAPYTTAQKAAFVLGTQQFSRQL